MFEGNYCKILALGVLCKDLFARWSLGERSDSLPLAKDEFISGPQPPNAQHGRYPAQARTRSEHAMPARIQKCCQKQSHQGEMCLHVLLERNGERAPRGRFKT